VAQLDGRAVKTAILVPAKAAAAAAKKVLRAIGAAMHGLVGVPGREWCMVGVL